MEPKVSNAFRTMGPQTWSAQCCLHKEVSESLMGRQMHAIRHRKILILFRPWVKYFSGFKSFLLKKAPEIFTIIMPLQGAAPLVIKFDYSKCLSNYKSILPESSFCGRWTAQHFAINLPSFRRSWNRHNSRGCRSAVPQKNHKPAQDGRGEWCTSISDPMSV